MVLSHYVIDDMFEQSIDKDVSILSVGHLMTFASVLFYNNSLYP